MLHSGSRGIGNSTAQHYDRLAADLLKKQGIKVPSKLHYMEVESEEGQAYLQVLTASEALAADFQAWHAAVALLPASVRSGLCQAATLTFAAVGPVTEKKVLSACYLWEVWHATLVGWFGLT